MIVGALWDQLLAKEEGEVHSLAAGGGRIRVRVSLGIVLEPLMPPLEGLIYA